MRALILGLFMFAPAAVAMTDAVRRLHASLLRHASDLAYHSQGRAAQEADLDQAQWRRQIDQIEGTHKRLAMQSDEWWQWYAVVIAQHFGVPGEVRIGHALERSAADLGSPALEK
jgi:hypothetical protein